MLEIKTAEFITSMADYGKFPGKGLPQIAVAGKSNVGKSTLINTLCRRNKLARTSATPGKTRLLNVFLLNNSFHLIDLPGYGFAKVDKKEKARWGQMMQDYCEKADELRHVLCLVDIRHEPTRHQGGQDQPRGADEVPRADLPGAERSALGDPVRQRRGRHRPGRAAETDRRDPFRAGRRRIKTTGKTNSLLHHAGDECIIPSWFRRT